MVGDLSLLGDFYINVGRVEHCFITTGKLFTDSTVCLNVPMRHLIGGVVHVKLCE